MRITRTFFRRQIGPALLLAMLPGFINPSRMLGQETTKPKNTHVRIVGRVVAKVWDVQGLHFPDNSQAENFTVFVISIEPKSSGKSEKFVRLTYRYTSLKDSLPISFFDYSIRYRFRVVRDARCDELVMDIQDPQAGKLAGLAAEIAPAIGAPTDTWDRHRPLDCYVLRPGGFTAEHPASNIVRVRFTESAGMCIGYCVEELTIRRNWSALAVRPNEKSGKYPELKAKRKLGKEEWTELERSIDAYAESALVGPIGCPGCVDQVVGSIEVHFGSGAKKSVTYNYGEAPPAISGMLRSMEAIRSKFSLKIPRNNTE